MYMYIMDALVYLVPGLVNNFCFGMTPASLESEVNYLNNTDRLCRGLCESCPKDSNLFPGIVVLMGQILVGNQECIQCCEGEYSHLFIPSSSKPGNSASCYLFYPDEWVTYASAQKLCGSTGGHVGGLETEEEDIHVQNIIRENELYVKGITPTWCGYWMCGSDSKEESRWIWEHTNQPFNYTNWVPGEPGNIALNEDGVVISMLDLKWVDVKKSSPFAVLCEKQPACQ